MTSIPFMYFLRDDHRSVLLLVVLQYRNHGPACRQRRVVQGVHGAHTVLTPYWAGRLGKEVMEAYQSSERGAPR